MIPEGDATLSIRRRLIMAVVMIGVVNAVGTFGYYAIGRGRWPLAECAYMTVVSVTTVGYGELLPGMAQVPFARAFTGILLFTGAGAGVYAVSLLTTLLVEGEFLNLRRRRRMQKRIAEMSGHIIICGAGRTGTTITTELLSAHWPFVLIDTSAEAINRIQKTCGTSDIAYMIADATEDRTLLEAGVQRAHGIIAALPEDKDNLYIIVTARGLSQSLRIVTKNVDPVAVGKLQQAGADRVVSVNRIGGYRLAAEMVRPNVVDFIETMMRESDKNLRFEEIAIPDGSSLAGKALAQSDLRRQRKLLVVAVGGPSPQSYTYSPGPDFVLQEGMTLIVLGETDSVRHLRESMSASSGKPSVEA